jgi:hypothetical protein
MPAPRDARLGKGPFQLTPAKGTPAIGPRIMNAGHETPAFSEQDAIDHVTKNGFVSNMHQPGRASIEKVEFVHSSVVATRYRRAQDSPDDRLLCVVTLTGSFSVATTPDLDHPQAARPVTGTAVHVIFDAHTGNYLGLHMDN